MDQTQERRQALANKRQRLGLRSALDLSVEVGSMWPWRMGPYGHTFSEN